jgi:acyl-CoA hydrolase
MVDTLIEDDQRALEMTEIMTPNMANFGGNVHGGALLQLIDRVAYACAARYSKCYCVTLSLDHMIFKKPIKVGELVTFYANVNYTGTTSLEIGIRVMSENINTGKKQHTNSCYVTMVAVDQDHKPTNVKKLSLNTSTDKRRFENAVLRKALRKEYTDKHSNRKK